MLFYGGSAFRVAVFFLLIGQTAAGNSRETVRVKKSFGYVQVAAGDLPAAIAEGRAAQRAARDVLGISKARFDIVESTTSKANWGDISRDGAPVYPWVFKRGVRNDQGGPPNYVLRHEIGHDLFVRYLVPRTGKDQYGGDAPDWLDEMAAVAFEACAQTESRRAEAKRFASNGTLIPLKRFLTMQHPELAAKRAFGSPGQVMTVASPTSDETPQFYAMARAFYDFLTARAKSPAVIADLAAAFRSGTSLEQWIMDKVSSSKSGKGLETLNTQFVNWIAADTRYQRAGESERNQHRSDQPDPCRYRD